MSTQPLSSKIKDPHANNGGVNAMEPDDLDGKKVFIETYGCQMNLADSDARADRTPPADAAAAERLLPVVGGALQEAGVEIRADERALPCPGSRARCRPPKPIGIPNTWTWWWR